MEFENLSQVHTARHAERSENDVNRTPVLRVRHIFLGENARDDTLVAVAACELVTDRDVTNLRDGDVNALDDATLELVAVLAREDLHADDAPALPRLEAEGCVLHVLCLLAED